VCRDGLFVKIDEDVCGVLGDIGEAKSDEFSTSPISSVMRFNKCRADPKKTVPTTSKMTTFGE
jgi:hypothetical protein